MSVVLSLQCKDRADGSNDGKGVWRDLYSSVCPDSGFGSDGKEDCRRLQQHIRMAEQAGADISTIYGDDIPQQIAEFARISGITKSYWGAPAYIAAISGVDRH